MAFGGENAESYYDEGLTASVRGDLTRAIECFEKAVSYDHAFSAAYHQLGKCYLRVGQADKAASLLSKVIEFNPLHVSARVELGFALMELGQLDEAGQHFRQALSAKPDNARALFGTASICFEKGEWDAAVTLAREALLHGGRSFSPLFLLGRAARMAGDIETSADALQEADKILEKSIELNPGNPEGYFLRGEVHFTREQLPKALEFFRAAEGHAKEEITHSAFGVSFNIIDILAKQAFCCQRLDAHDRALELGRRILEKDPDNRIGMQLTQT